MEKDQASFTSDVWLMLRCFKEPELKVVDSRYTRDRVGRAQWDGITLTTSPCQLRVNRKVQLQSMDMGLSVVSVSYLHYFGAGTSQLSPRTMFLPRLGKRDYNQLKMLTIQKYVVSV